MLCHGIRYKIFPSGQYFPHGTHLRGHMLDAVDDSALIIAEDDVAVLAHNLDHQLLLAQIAQFIQMLDIKDDDTLQLGLGDAGDPSISDMLAKKHAEVGGCHGTRLILVCQIYQREGCAGRDIEPFLSLRSLDGKQQLVWLRLGDLGDPSVCQRVF